MTAPTEPLYRLTYLSSASTHLAPADLTAILAVARERNSVAGVTGLLLFHDDNFFQTLEGSKDDVECIYASIERDARHKSCLVLERRECGARLFDQWAMAFRRTSDLQSVQLAGFQDIARVCERSARSAPKTREVTETLMDGFLTSFRDL